MSKLQHVSDGNFNNLGALESYHFKPLDEIVFRINEALSPYTPRLNHSPDKYKAGDGLVEIHSDLYSFNGGTSFFQKVSKEKVGGILIYSDCLGFQDNGIQSSLELLIGKSLNYEGGKLSPFQIRINVDRLGSGDRENIFYSNKNSYDLLQRVFPDDIFVNENSVDFFDDFFDN